MLQLRAKSLPPRDFLTLAQLVRSETESHDCRLIVNDRVDIALACDADGVHLGQDDLPLHVGRKLVGNKIIGISTHDIEQAQASTTRRRRLHRLRPDVRHARPKTPATAPAASTCSRKSARRCPFPSSPSAASPNKTSAKFGKPAPTRRRSSAIFWSDADIAGKIQRIMQQHWACISDSQDKKRQER